MPAEYHADHVGSFLRPPLLKAARAAFKRGEIDRDRLTEVEDRAILGVLQRQREIGIDVVTDGELRRTGFQNDINETVDGYIDVPQPAVVRIWQGPGGDPVEEGTRQIVAGKLRPRRRLTANQLPFLKQHASGPIKMTLPTPNQFPTISYQPGVTDKVYPTRADLLRDLTAIIRDEVQYLVSEGVRYIQLDAPRYSYFVDPKWREHLRGMGEDPDRFFDAAIAADNEVLAGARRPGATLALHVCRGNNQSKWYAQGGYDAIAEKLFGGLQVDRFVLEYDTERAGTFEPLRFVPRGRAVVLGLVSSKDPALESSDALRRRIDEAAAYVPLEDLALSPQCGFASTEPGNLLTEEQQWRKLALVAETARQVWG
ncbi:MAG: methionine synthase [Chloroflexota bacterium]